METNDQMILPSFSKYSKEILKKGKDDFLSTKRKELAEQEDHIKTFRQNLERKDIGGSSWVTYLQLKDYCRNAPKTVKELIGRAEFYACCLDDLDAYGRLSMELVFKYLSRHLTIFNYKILLTNYDNNLCGWLSKEEMMDFYEVEIMLTHPALKDMDESLKVYYLITVELKFFFFLDSKNFKRIRIIDIIASGYLDEVLSMEENDDISWFSPTITRDLLFEFDGLDSTRQGILDHKDMLRYNESSLTPAFVRRLFLVLHNEGKPPGLAYDDFTEFSLAYKNPKDFASIRYFFKMLDVNGDGFIDQTDVKYFYPDLAEAFQSKVVEEGAMPSFADVYDQLYDMVSPSDSIRISVDDLINSGQGHIFVLCLIDHIEFHKYEFRESPTGEEDQDSVFPLDDENNQDLSPKEISV